MNESVLSTSEMTMPARATSTFRSLRWPTALLLGAVILLAVTLRWPATQRGFFHWDEAQYFFGVQPAVLALREALGIQDWPRLFAERAPFDREKVSYFALSAKPGYDLLVILFGTLVGLTPGSIGLLSLFFGLGTLVVLYQIAQRTFGESVAISSVVILAVSTYHAFYSGSQSPVAMATFFLLLGVASYLRALDEPSLTRFALTGATLAYAYGCHYNLLLYVLMIFGIQALRVATVPRAGGIRSVLVMGLSFLGVIAFFELFYQFLIAMAYDHLSDGRGAYLAQLWYAMGFFRWAIPSGVERFPLLLLDSEGGLVLGLALLGWTLSTRQAVRDWPHAILLGLPAIHGAAAIYAGVFGSPVFSRTIVAILPFIALWAGVGLVRLAETLGGRLRERYAGSVALAVGVALVLVVGLPRTWTVTHLKAGYEETARYVVAQGGQQVSMGLPVEQYYLGSFSGTYPLPTSLDALRSYRKAGVRLLVLDHRVHILEEWGIPLGPRLREFERSHQPRAVIANPIAATLLFAGENAMSRDALARTLADQLSSVIRIYDLDDFLREQ